MRKKINNKKISLEICDLPIHIEIHGHEGKKVQYILRPAGKKLGACLNKLDDVFPAYLK